MKDPNVWTARDARAHLSEPIGKARAGAPQTMTMRGKAVVTFADPERFGVRVVS
jgi:prevent-host-death family protein